ncbi:MAG: hypothetical protein J1E07_05795 [Treponema sp.]|nr:hypothetical protein [Treponema sp.]
MMRITLDDFLRLRRIFMRGARPLDYTRWKFLFEDGSPDDFLSVLASYQNEDGGFGHNIECNNWNPASAPYTVCIALDYLDLAAGFESGAKSRIIAGIIRYLSSMEHFVEGGWLGMQGIKSNDDFAHMPWFHFDPAKESSADVGVTKRLCDFIIRNADKSSGIFRTARELAERYKADTRFVVCGYPDYDPVALGIKDYNPETYPAWLPLPVYFIGSPQSGFYADCARTVAQNLDKIAGNLLSLDEIRLLSSAETDAYERANPHPAGGRWCTGEQAVAQFFWGSNFIVRDLEILRRFGRLDFELPVRAL